MKRGILTLFTSFCVFIAFGQHSTDTIYRIVEASYQSGYDDSPKQAVEKAKSEALQKASEEIGGIYVTASKEFLQQEIYQNGEFVYNEDFKNQITTFTLSNIRIKILNDPYEYYMKNNGKVWIKIKASVAKSEMDKYFESIANIKKQEKEKIVESINTKVSVENIYGTLMLETTFPGKLFFDGNWVADITKGQQITLDYLKEGNHTLFIKISDDKSWEKVVKIEAGKEERIIALLSEYKSAVDFNLGVNLDLGPIYAYVKRDYQIENRGRFLIWKDLGSRKDVAYITDQGRILICSTSPLRSFADIDAFHYNLTIIMLDYLAKVQPGINADKRNWVWDWSGKVLYAQEKSSYKRLIYWGPNKGYQVYYKFPWTLKIPKMEVFVARMYIDAEHSGGFGQTKKNYFWNNTILGSGVSHVFHGGDISKYCIYGSHLFDIRNTGSKGYGVNSIFFCIETINSSTPEKIDILTGDGDRLVDSTPCWNIEELNLPR
ncbi:MAG: hypothetical protein K8S16_08430 [Bacteroidales bacterium]|nr:hypothetical protein [Bacteroidales bacterium]